LILGTLTLRTVILRALIRCARLVALLGRDGQDLQPEDALDLAESPRCEKHCGSEGEHEDDPVAEAGPAPLTMALLACSASCPVEPVCAAYRLRVKWWRVFTGRALGDLRHTGSVRRKRVE